MNTKKGIFKNTLYNFAGSAFPLVIAVFTIPFLLRGLGTEKFGILSLAWVMIGYFSIADLGLSRALTKLVSEKMGQGKRFELPSLIWTALSLMTIMGVVGASILALLSPVLVRSILKIESTNIADILNSFYVLSIAIPFTIGGAGLRAILEALMRFDLSNYVRIALGVFNFLGPAIVLLFSKNILFVVIILAVSRVISLIVYLKACFAVLPEMKKKVVFCKSEVVPLLKFGGWITVSNMISPIMVSFDRFFLGAMVAVSALAYYSTPWEIVTKLLIIPASLAGVLFPVFSQLEGRKNLPSSDIYYRSLKYVLLIMFPFCLICTSFAKEILQVWLGHEFAYSAFRIMQIMAVAVLLNGMAAIPFSLIQATGKPDITAKFHLMEVVLYIPVLWLLIKKWGIIGAALAWLIRVAIDLFLLLYYSNKFILPGFAKSPNNKILAAEYSVLMMIIIIILPAYFDNLTAKIFTTIFALIVYAAVSWKGLLDTNEKKYITDKLRWNSD